MIRIKTVLRIQIRREIVLRIPIRIKTALGTRIVTGTVLGTPLRTPDQILCSQLSVPRPAHYPTHLQGDYMLNYLIIQVIEMNVLY